MIKKLEWDSNFFGKNIALIDSNHKIDFDEIDDFITGHKIDILQASCAIENIESINKLEEYGLQYKELSVRVISNIKSEEKSYNVIEASMEDITGISMLLDGMFVNSRHSHIFTQEQVTSFYLKWVEQAILGKFDDICFVYKLENKIAGFITLKYLDQDFGVIGLLGVDEKFIGRGIGSALIKYIKKFLGSKGLKTLITQTQGSNLKAQNFYIKNDFLIDSINVWMYKKI